MGMGYTSETDFCVATGEMGVDYHHVKARGMGGRHAPRLDEPWNLMPLRHEKHVEVETIGIVRFANKYSGARKWLEKNGWYICPIRRTWRHAAL